jgi:predicted dehydrogenase
MRHFARCVRGKETLQATGEDGKVVMEALYAAYASAGMGQKVQMPYKPKKKTPIEEWLGRKAK